MPERSFDAWQNSVHVDSTKKVDAPSSDAIAQRLEEVPVRLLNLGAVGTFERPEDVEAVLAVTYQVPVADDFHQAVREDVVPAPVAKNDERLFTKQL